MLFRSQRSRWPTLPGSAPGRGRDRTRWPRSPPAPPDRGDPAKRPYYPEGRARRWAGDDPPARARGKPEIEEAPLSSNVTEASPDKDTAAIDAEEAISAAALRAISFFMLLFSF